MVWVFAGGVVPHRCNFGHVHQAHEASSQRMPCTQCAHRVHMQCGVTSKRGCQIKRRRGRRIPPLFWGHLRSIPQGMIFDVQPLVKSLFCPIRQSPNGFFYSEASIP